MDISIRTIKSEEIKYTYSQSHQLNAQTGCIGHLRGDMDSDGTLNCSANKTRRQ